jgi:hypothetical protein
VTLKLYTIYDCDVRFSSRVILAGVVIRLLNDISGFESADSGGRVA